MQRTKNAKQKIVILAGMLVTSSVLMTTSAYATDTVKTVSPVVETTNSHHSGDTADDTCVWINPNDKQKSLIIGDDKHGGLCVWNLDGTENQYLDSESYLNNLDIRYNFKLGNQKIALIGAVNENGKCLSFYKVNSVTRKVENIGSISLDIEKPYGGCMYQSPTTGKTYFFVNWKDGTVQQWELNGDTGTIKGSLARTFDVGNQVEGCVADDQLSKFYIGEEDVGLWSYGAEPSDSNNRTSVDNVDSSVGGHLTADVEGVTLYYGGNKDKGYLICSSQGNSTFQVYERKDNKYLGAFTIGATNTIDETTETDGCDVSNVDLGGLFSKGIFICHDHSNNGTDYSNNKLVSWNDIAKALDLDVDTSYDPTKGSNKAPELKDIDDKSVNAGETLTFTIKASDSDNNQLEYTALDLPDGTTFNAETRQFSWTPDSSQTGSYKVNFYVSDGYLVDHEKVKITVKSSN